MVMPEAGCVQADPRQQDRQSSEGGGKRCRIDEPEISRGLRAGDEEAPVVPGDGDGYGQGHHAMCWNQSGFYALQSPRTKSMAVRKSSAPPPMRKASACRKRGKSS